MNRKQFLLTLSLAVISAFLGGNLGVWFLVPPSVLAQDKPPKVIEAQEFRVVDGEGKIRAEFAVNDLGDPFMRFLDENVSWRSSFELGIEYDYDDSLQPIPQTGQPRLTLNGNNALFSLTPAYLIVTRNGKGNISAVSLGISDDDLSPHEGPSLWLRDKNGKKRAVLGTTELTLLRTGSTEIRAPSSLVLFDEERKVVWEAP